MGNGQDRFSKFLGLLKVEVEGEEPLELDIKLSEKYKIMKLMGKIRSDTTDEPVNQLVNLLKGIIMRCYPDAKEDSIDAFLNKKFEDLLTGLSIAFKWTTKEDIEKRRKLLEKKLEKEIETKTEEAIPQSEGGQV
jgi:hypothetical protein